MILCAFSLRTLFMKKKIDDIKKIDTSKVDPDFVYDPMKRKTKTKWSKKRKIITIVVSALILGLVGFGLVKAFALLQIFKKNGGLGAIGLKGDLDLNKLKGEGEGRVNILLLGVGDPNHAGADLTDTMMVVSLDPRTNDVAMLSVPRDLYVKIPGYGYDKINAAHSHGEMKQKGSGPELSKKTVSETLDIPIHYFVRIDFFGLKKAVDTVGGIDVEVEKDLVDPYYPCEKNENLKCVFRIKKGLVHMDGATALKYARSRETTSDFDRAKRQQQVLVALRDKALQLQTVSNPAKISALIDVFGSHVATDLQLWEMNKLMEFSKKIDPSKIINKVLDNSSNGYLIDGNVNGAYVLKPRTGNFKAIQAFVRSIFVDGYIKQENASVQVENGTSKSGLAAKVAELLKSYNYNIVGIASADNVNYGETVIIDYTDGKKPYTIKYLENRFNAKAQKADPSKKDDGSSALGYDIKIIVGSNYNISEDE